MKQKSNNTRACLVFISCIMVVTVLSGCDQPTNLKGVYKKDFSIGCAVGSQYIDTSTVIPMRRDTNELHLIVNEFNSVTPENLMKWDYIQSRPGEFNFDQADEFMEFAEENHLAVNGHVLIWHSQTPDWVFKDDAGNLVSREVLIDRMRNHIHTVVGRYKGRIKSWDVVNEAVCAVWVVDRSLPLDANGKPQRRCKVILRNSLWRQIIGDDYIELAFRFAHEADPDAKLYINDYGMTEPEKSEFIAQMVRDFKQKGVPIDGVGMEGHWYPEYPSMEDLQSAIDRFASAGASVSITELEITVIPWNHWEEIFSMPNARAKLDPYTAGVPEDVLNCQARKYRDIFTVLQANSEHIDRVTFWGVSDRYTWRNNFPIPGRTAHPLLFDRQFKPKPAYTALIENRKSKNAKAALLGLSN